MQLYYPSDFIPGMLPAAKVGPSVRAESSQSGGKDLTLNRSAESLAKCEHLGPWRRDILLWQLAQCG